MGASLEFTSELLRANGLLQTSITELRYRCEVYRLSLRSICKTLANVQKEQEGRLRCLTTCRPNYQTYLLNLSQKQALDRIKNVVRKASTFINGYALVDTRLFQPPPPKPGPWEQRNTKRVAFCITTDTGEVAEPILNSNADESDLTKPEAGGRLLPIPGSQEAEYTEASKKKQAPSARSSKIWRTRKQEKSSKSIERSPSLPHKPEVEGRYRAGMRSGRNNENGMEMHNGSSLRFTSLKEREEKQKKVSSKSITCHRFQVINPHTRYPPVKRVNLPADERLPATSVQSRAGERSLEGKTKTSSYQGNKASWRTEVRRRPSKEQQTGRRESSSHMSDRLRLDERKGSVHPARLKDVRGSKSTTKTTRYKVRESLALVRHHHRGTDSSANDSQGQGVARKYLFPTHHHRHNNFKLKSDIVGYNGMARRAALKGRDGDSKSRMHRGLDCESKNKSNFLGARNVSQL